VDQKLEIITLKVKTLNNAITGTSINGDNFCKVYSEVIETRENGSIVDDKTENNNISLIFWMKEKNFDSKTQAIISSLKKDQIITVHGNIQGQNNGLMKVLELETEEDIFI